MNKGFSHLEQVYEVGAISGQVYEVAALRQLMAKKGNTGRKCCFSFYLLLSMSKIIIRWVVYKHRERKMLLPVIGPPDALK